MKRTKLYIYGVGKFAEYAAYVFSQDTNYEFLGYCIEPGFLEKKIYAENFKQNIQNFEELHQISDDKNFEIFIAVGNNKLRKRIFEKALELKYGFASYISSKAMVWENLKIGRNVFIGEGSIIQPFVEIGDGSIHFSTHIGHHSKIGNHTLLSVTTLGGNVEVGNDSYLGMNSTVKQNIKIAEKNIIGMNVAINMNTAPNSVFSNKSSSKREITYQQIEKKFSQ